MTGRSHCVKALGALAVLGASIFLSVQPASADDDLGKQLAQGLQGLGSGLQNTWHSLFDSLPTPALTQATPTKAPDEITEPANPSADMPAESALAAVGSSDPLPSDPPLSEQSRAINNDPLALLGVVSAPLKDRSSAAMCISALRVNEDDRDFTYSSDPDCLQFTLRNSLSPRINPQGGQGYLREYLFGSIQGSRQEEVLHIHEKSVGAADSASSMETEITFIPRLVLPAVRLSADKSRYVVMLPTGETVDFDAKSKEIVGGALAETAPIDLNTNRQTRQFVGLKYLGKGITIRSDQRAESTRTALVWGLKKQATLTYQGHTCVVSPAELWNQSIEYNPFLFATDEEFYVFIRKRCGWTIEASTFSDLQTAVQGQLQ